MTSTTRKPGSRPLGWILMVSAMVIMLASIFTEAIRPAVAVPIGAMFMVFSIILLGASSSKRDESSK